MTHPALTFPRRDANFRHLRGPRMVGAPRRDNPNPRARRGTEQGARRLRRCNVERPRVERQRNTAWFRWQPRTTTRRRASPHCSKSPSSTKTSKKATSSRARVDPASARTTSSSTSATSPKGQIPLDEFTGADGAGRRQGRRRDRRLPREPRERQRPRASSPRRRPTGSRSGTRSRAACERDELIEGTISAAREGRPLGHHPRRREGVPPRLAGRPAPGPQPRRVHRQDLPVQGHQVQQEARQHRAVAPRAPREGARRAEGGDAREAQGGPDRRGHRQEPHRVRRVHRPRRHRRPAPHHRHELGPRQPPVRAVPGRRRRPRQGPQVQRRDRARLASASSRSARIRGTTPHEKYPPGTVVRGKVVSLKDYGAFIELEQGIEGLVHISEMSLDQAGQAPVEGRRRRRQRRGGRARHRRQARTASASA